MSKSFSPSLAISLTALVVALGGAAFSATGGNFILGRINSAENQSGIVSPVNGKMLLLNNTSTAANATALGLTVKSGHPPMVVNSDVKVFQLNADKLDDRDSSDFANATNALVFRDADTVTLKTGDKFWPLPGLTPGNYIVTLTTAIRPTTGSAGAPNNVICVIVDLTAPFPVWAEQWGEFDGSFSRVGVSGADTIEVTAANASTLRAACSAASGTWRLFDPLQVSFIPINSRTITPVVVLPKTSGMPKL